jgi:hypothetical protein
MSLRKILMPLEVQMTIIVKMMTMKKEDKVNKLDAKPSED